MYIKKIKQWLLILTGLLLCLSSCKFSNSPESVTRKFLTSFNQLDFSTAKSLSTSDTWEILNIMETATKSVSDKRKKELAANFSVKILKVQKESDSTTIVTFKTQPKRLPFNQLKLLKTLNKDGEFRWKVDISTLDLLNSEHPSHDSIPINQPISN